MRIAVSGAGICAAAAIMALAGCMSGANDAKTRAPVHAAVSATVSPARPLAAAPLRGSALPFASALPHGSALVRGSATPSSPKARTNHAGQLAAQPTKRPPLQGAAPPDPRPYILGAGVSPTIVGSGTSVSALVRTTPGVVAVTAYAAGSSLSLARIAAGQFAATTTLPMLPPGVHGVFAVTFVARDARGRSTQTAVNVSVR